MDIKELDKSTMDSVKNLAEINIQISEARNALSSIKELETEYLKERENKTLVQLNKILSESKAIIAEVKGNSAEIQDLLNTVTTFATFLKEAHKDFATLLDNFEEEQIAWKENIADIQKGFLETKNTLKVQKEYIENEKKNIKEQYKLIEKEKRVIESEKGIINRKIIRLKEGKI